MNIVNISYMSKAEIESAYHQFDKEQLAAAVARLLALIDEGPKDYSSDSCGCCCLD
tara:strand:+ start:500 stop:667 length:168 start_codon:yes stop_codon:yes gene_type:complete